MCILNYSCHGEPVDQIVNKFELSTAFHSRVTATMGQTAGRQTDKQTNERQCLIPPHGAEHANVQLLNLCQTFLRLLAFFRPEFLAFWPFSGKISLYRSWQPCVRNRQKTVEQTVSNAWFATYRVGHNKHEPVKQWAWQWCNLNSSSQWRCCCCCCCWWWW